MPPITNAGRYGRARAVEQLQRGVDRVLGTHLDTQHGRLVKSQHEDILIAVLSNLQTYRGTAADGLRVGQIIIGLNFRLLSCWIHADDSIGSTPQRNQNIGGLVPFGFDVHSGAIAADKEATCLIAPVELTQGQILESYSTIGT